MTIQTLIRNKCANYFPDSGGKGKIKNYCCLLDKSCTFFLDEKLSQCKYFEKGVLPLEPDLEFKYKKERKLSTLELIRTCKRCLQPFAGSKKEKYCRDCKNIRNKETAKLRMQKMRKVI
jgi:hypothetical protein